MVKVHNVRQLIERFGTLAAFGKAICPDSDQPSRYAHDIRRRGTIPPHLWAATIRHAAARGVGLTERQLRDWRRRAKEASRG